MLFGFRILKLAIKLFNTQIKAILLYGSKACATYTNYNYHLINFYLQTLKLQWRDVSIQFEWENVLVYDITGLAHHSKVCARYI